MKSQDPVKKNQTLAQTDPSEAQSAVRRPADMTANQKFELGDNLVKGITPEDLAQR